MAHALENGATGQVSVGTSATPIVSARHNRRAIAIANHGSTDVFIGFTDAVTTATGLLLKGSAGALLSLTYSGPIFGVVAAGSQTVSFAELFD